ncbi:MAG: efflux RND transporter permease subunit [Candidatus Woesearchaeota archaeon]
MIEKAVNKLLDFSKILVFGFLALFVILFFFALQLQIDPSFSSLISDDTEFNTNERLLGNILGTSDTFIIIAKLDETSFLLERPLELSQPQIQEHLELIRTTVNQSQFVRQVLPVQMTDDQTYAQIIIQTATPRNIQGFADVIDDIERHFLLVNTYPGLDISLTGFPLLLNEVNTLIISDNIKTIAFTIIAIFLVLYAYFRSLRLTMITLLIPLMSVVMLGGVMSFFSIPISITLAIVGILTVALGVDFAIHLIVSYESYLEKRNSHRKSIVLAVKHLYLAIIASFLTTAAGFSALIFGISPATQSQGIVLMIAISIIALLTIIFFPCAIYLFSDGHLPPKNPLFESIKRFLGKFAIVQARRPKTVLLFLGIATVFLFGGVVQIGFDTSNDNWIPPDNPIQDSFRENSYAFGNDFSTLQIILTSQERNLKDVQVVRDIQNLQAQLLAIPEVETIRSPFTDLPLDQTLIHEQIDGTNFNEDFTFTALTLQATSFDSDAGGDSVVLEHIRERIDQNPIYYTEVGLFGDVIRFRELGESLGRDTGITTILSFLFVFLIASVIYLSFAVGMIAISPIIIGIIWTLGFMGYFQVPFTSLSTGLIALVLGIGIDFSIHLVNSTRNYVRDGIPLEKALQKTMTYSGGALLLTSVTTFIGFFSLILASLLGIQRLGLSLAFSILAVFLVTIIMVPSVLQLTLKKKT